MLDEDALIEKETNETAEILTQFSAKPGNLIPILQQIQARLGYLPRKAMLQTAKFLNVPSIDVYSVATFYNQFRFIPRGKHHIRVCKGTACHMKGGDIILDAWERRLKIKERQTTPDRECSLETVACVGCCAMAPVAVVDEEVYAKITPTRVDGILLSFEIERKKQEGQQ